ncbi:MAG: hypothetical protein MMC23_006181 [Stictis urceolatum]|nr:hypothetical protein [Stictis urceolata]
MDGSDIVNSPSYSPFARIGNAARAHALRLSGQSGLAAGHRWRRPSNSTAKPTFTKTFPRYPEILCRVFIPRPEVCHPGLLPLYIDVHGGGFIMGDPDMDDHFCSQLAETNGICVLAISHRKAPYWKFPTAVDDVSGVATSILDGDSLPIDRSRVAIGGFSTGGTLALAAAQTSYLKGRVEGVVAFSPLTDMTVSPGDKLASVPENDEPDRLGKDFANLVQRAYVRPNTDLRDPLLSPVFANRLELPTNVYIIGSEYDMLCAEAERMAVGLAAQEVGDEVAGPSDRWEKGGIRWELVRGWRHNFTHIAEKGIRETERQQVVEDLFNRVGEWLREKVYL